MKIKALKKVILAITIQSLLDNSAVLKRGGRAEQASQNFSQSRAGIFCCIHWFLYQLPLEERILRMKNVWRSPRQAVKTLKCCYWWVHTQTKYMLFWLNYNQNGFLRNLANIFSFGTCLIKFPNNNMEMLNPQTREN